MYSSLGITDEKAAVVTCMHSVPGPGLDLAVHGFTPVDACSAMYAMWPVFGVTDTAAAQGGGWHRSKLAHDGHGMPLALQASHGAQDALPHLSLTNTLSAVVWAGCTAATV